jgi:thiosulfate/3-mercaptopyruvate sulfurtransferase
VIEPIVDAEWLLRRLDAVVVCEVGSGTTGGSTPDDHRAGHLPGARFVSVDDDLAGAPGPVVGRHPLPSPEDFAARLGALGIGAGTTVVAYDRHGGAFASRLVWMLRTIGQDAALLDGGFDAWTGPVESGTVDTPPVDRAPVPWPASAVASADEVVAHIESGGVVVDSRAGERYRGETEPIDAVAGHIPDAVNLPFADVAADSYPIVYCGSGVTACHNALVFEHATGRRPRVYVGSWSGWSTDSDRPIATGSAG